MAAIGKIRSWGPVLVIVIGFALFAFIAGDLWKSCEATGAERRQQVGEVLGKKISVQEFQALVDEYQDVIKMTQGRDNLSEEEQNQLKDQVWQQFVNNTIIEKQAAKLGLTVTDAELQNILRQGTNPLLMQSPFVNQQTGRFDVTQLTKFLNDYKKVSETNPQMAEQYQTIYKYWKFLEKTLRQNTLAQKYQSLLSHCLISNPVSAKMAFDGQNQESDIKLAAIPYNSIKDSEIQVSDADLKAKYNAEKEMFRQYVETRDIKYVDFQVLPSDADRSALMKTMTDAQQKLQSGATPAEVVRKAQSQLPYTGIAATKSAYPTDIAAKIDSMQVGQVTAPFETKFDNTLNVVKLIAKIQQADSVEYRQIQFADVKQADSAFTALKGGADFEAIAKKYGQDGQKQWMTSAMYERAQNIDSDTKTYIETLNSSPVNEVKNLAIGQGNILLQVTARRAMVDKYDVAVVKHTIDFSKGTYSDAYNKFSQFVSESGNNLEALEKNAQKYGFNVLERKDMLNSEHGVAGLRATRETMKWIFDAKAGDVSPLYECGNNDHLLVVALTKTHPAGYRALDAVQDMLKQEVIRDKKFEKAAEKLAGVKSIAEAEKKGANVSDVAQVTFSAPVFVQTTGSSEPALSGAVAATKRGAFHAQPVKGNGGAYVFQVEKKADGAGKYDEKATLAQLQQRALQAASRYLNELYTKANVVDNRYLFF